MTRFVACSQRTMTREIKCLLQLVQGRHFSQVSLESIWWETCKPQSFYKVSNEQFWRRLPGMSSTWVTKRIPAMTQEAKRPGSRHSSEKDFCIPKSELHSSEAEVPNGILGIATGAFSVLVHRCSWSLANRVWECLASHSGQKMLPLQRGLSQHPSWLLKYNAESLPYWWLFTLLWWNICHSL